jgi:hypothetical protein
MLSAPSSRSDQSQLVRRDEERQGPRPANDNGSHSGEPSILAFGGLSKPSADQRITIRAAAANAMRR